MARIVYHIGISLDGFIAGPNGEIDWHLVDEELHWYMNEVLDSPTAAFIGGRLTYELMADFWPDADKDPSTPPPMVEFARIWREKPKYVFSRTLPAGELPWGTTVLNEVTPAVIEAIKARFEGDIVVGGANLASEFRRLGLVDEYRIYVHPVIIGAGIPFLTDESRENLALVESRTFGNGVVLLHYQRKPV